MRRALATLKRVRSAQKKAAKQAFAEAERSRIQQETRIEEIHAAMAASHDDGFTGGQAHELAQEQAYRLRLQATLRREAVVLNERAKKAADRRGELREADRDTRVVELALERHDERVALEKRRSDGRRIDEIASGRWWRDRS